MKHHKGILKGGATSLGTIDNTGNDIISRRYIKDGGLSTQYLMADGSISTAGSDVSLGNPPVDDYILSSTAEGIRTWVPQAEGVTDHTLLFNKGQYTHSQIDSHIGTLIIHFTQEDINIPASQISDFDIEVANNPTVINNTSKVSNVAHPLVETAVPIGALFTDTVYDDTTIQAAVTLNTDKVSNVAHPLVETAVPSGAIFTDTVYDDTAIQAEVALNTDKVTNVVHPLVETAVPLGAVFTDTDTVYDDSILSAAVALNTDKVTNIAHPLVETAVPVGAVFTDTLYDDSVIQAEVDLNTDKISNVDHPLVETAVPLGALFTDTVYDDTAIQNEVDLNTDKVSDVVHPLVETAVPLGALFTDTLYDDTDVLKDADVLTPISVINKLITQSDISAFGGGDMLKSIYDTTGNSIVDNSELVNGLTVETAVPAGALFTDTLYDDSTVLQDADALTPVTGINKLITQDDIAALGGGDMLKSVYDTTGNNIVDNSELVNSLTVETAVPVSALFTDTIYDDTTIQAAVALNTDKVSNVDHPLVETAVPLGALFTDTVYDDTTIQAAVALNTDKETNIVHPLVETAVPIGALFTDTDTIYDDTTLAAAVALNTDKVTNVAHPLVETAVPLGAVFTDTDTIYDDSILSAAVALNTDKVTNVAHPLVETAVPIGAVFTDTVYDPTILQAEVDLNTDKVTNIAHPLVETAVPLGAVFTDTLYNDSDVLKDIDALTAVTEINKLITEADITTLGSILSITGSAVNNTDPTNPIIDSTPTPSLQEVTTVGNTTNLDIDIASNTASSFRASNVAVTEYFVGYTNGVYGGVWNTNEMAFYPQALNMEVVALGVKSYLRFPNWAAPRDIYFPDKGGTIAMLDDITAGGSTISTRDEGVSVLAASNVIDFVGAGVVATGATTITTVTIPGQDFNIQANGGAITAIGTTETINFINGTATTAAVVDQANPTVSYSVNTNGITATQLNVAGNGTTAQYLRSDGDGTFTWATPVDTNTNTQLSTEAVQDIAGGMINISAAQSGMGVTYNDTTGKIDFNLSHTHSYDNYSWWGFQALNSSGTSLGSSIITSTDYAKFRAGSNVTLSWADDQITINSTDTDTNTWRPITSTPSNGATTTSISSDWAFDNVKTPVPSGALFTDTDTNTQLSQAQVGTFATNEGFIKTDTNTQLSQAQVGTFATAEGFIKTDTNTQLSQAQVGTYATNEGFIKTDTNTWRPVTAGGNALSTSETLTFVAGTGVTITESAGSVTINSTASGGISLTSLSADSPILYSNTTGVFSHATSAGNKHIPSGGLTNQILRYSASGTAVWSNEQSTLLGLGIITDATSNTILTDGGEEVTILACSATKAGLITSGTQTVYGAKTFNSNVTAPDFIGSSDIRKKENTEILIPKEITSVYKTGNFIGDEQERVFVIAQELEVTHPEFVRTDDEGMKSVSYIDLHSAEIAYLKKENAELKVKLEMIMNKLEL